MQNNFKKVFYSPLAIFLVVALLSWSLGLPSWISRTNAANLTEVSDLLSDSDLSVVSNHTITFKTQTIFAAAASSTLTVNFDDTFDTSALDPADAADFDIATSSTLGGSYTDLTVYAAGGCPNSGQTAFQITSETGGGTEILTFTHCNGTQALAAGTYVKIEAGTNATSGGTGNSQITNPISANSYVTTITGPDSTDTADTRVAIIDDVVMSATVATSLSFTVNAVASGNLASNETASSTSITTTATTIPWGTLTAGATNAKYAAQRLNVSTNAANGFAVTVQATPFQSSTGAEIDSFANGTIAAPSGWTSPTGVIGQLNTYGHFGVTSADATLAAGDTFGASLYAGVPTTTATQIFYHSAPSDGTTTGIGSTTVGYQVEISALQEAASDYANTITYIATPVF